MNIEIRKSFEKDSSKFTVTVQMQISKVIEVIKKSVKLHSMLQKNNWL